jgi:undecaprenyl-diphosphatase
VNVWEVLQAVLLGVLQGLTEFLPVSSSGHLVLVPELLGIPAPGLTFDAVVHGGTALALIAYFRRDWQSLAGAAWLGLRDAQVRSGPEWQTATSIAVGTVPAVVAGLLLQDFFEGLFEAPRVAAVMLLVTGVLLVSGERLGRRRPPREGVAPGGALAIGCAQAAAIVPGISRSGATIAAGQAYGLDRHRATRFSFLLAAPATAAAAALRTAEMLGGADDASGMAPLALIVGFVAAFVSGYWAIGWLLDYARRSPLLAFAVYVWLLGLISLLLI